MTVEHPGGQAAVSGVSLAIAPGEQLAFIGPSGAGKTTLLSVLGAALRPSRGEVMIDGEDPWSIRGPRLRALRSRLFHAPQAPPLPPRQRVVTAVLAGRLPHWSLAKALGSLWHAADAELAYQALQAFSLEHKLWSRVDRLSGGERQRVGLARALVADARALFVDEPLSALDPALAAQTLQMLTRHAAGRGATLVCSLHQVDLALAHFPRVVGLRDGQVLFDEAPAQIGAEQVKRLYFERETGSPAEAANVAVMLDRPPPVAPSRCT